MQLLQLFIGAPVYSGAAHPAHEAAVKASIRYFGGSAVYHRQPGDSSLPRARATLFGAFLQYEREWTHFLQCDDDQSWDPRVLEHLIELDYPAICLPCALKCDPPHPFAGVSSVRGYVGERPDPDGTIRVRYMGGGWILWRRDALEALCTPEREFWTNGAARERQKTYMLWCGGLSEPDADGRREYLTEDYWISHLARQAGIEPRCYLRACSPHWKGDKPYLPLGYEMERAA